MESFDSNSSTYSWETILNVGEQAFLSLIGILMAITGGLGNGVVVILVFCSPAMKSAINLLLATLALTDTLVLLLILPLDIVTLIGQDWLLPVSMCYGHGYLLTVFHLQGLMILTVICIDRYIIIIYRQDRLTPSNASWIIVGSWVFSAFIALPPLLKFGTYITPPLPVSLTHCMWKPSDRMSSVQLLYACVVFIFIYLLPVVVMSACSGSVIRKIRNDSAKIYTTSEDSPTNFNGVVQCFQDDAKLSSHKTLVPLDLRYKIRTFTTIFMLFLVYVTCRSPLHIAQIASVFSEEESNYHKVHVWLLWWAYLQPALNPIIYTVRIKAIREELFEYFPFLLCLLPAPSNDVYRRSDAKVVYTIKDQRITVS